jgi:ornithine carbamoyltransferase
MFNEFISIADVKTEDIFKLLALAEKVKRSPKLYQRRLTWS